MTNRRRELDGVRGIAIIWVLLYHLFGLVQKHETLAVLPFIGTVAEHGWIGVSLFFALSGYLITLNLSLQENNIRGLRQFWIRRAFRLLPIYAMLLGTFVVARIYWPVTSPLYERVLNTLVSPWSHAAFVQNIYMVPVGYLGNEWLRVTWSLALEVQFYALICAVFVLLPRRWIGPVLGLLFAASIGFRYWIFRDEPNVAVALMVLLPARLDAFALGGMLALVPAGLARIGGISRPLLGWLLLVGSTTWLGIFSRGGFGAQTALLIPLYYSVISLGCTALIDLCAHASPAVQRLARFPVLTRAGDLSYFLYLFHMPVAFTVFALVMGTAPNLQTPTAIGTMSLALGILWGLAVTSFRFVELPSIRYSRTLG